MAELKALFFDQDGTIIDTEKDGHRVAFNRTFTEFGFPVQWDVETYHELLQIAGGKERMRAYLHQQGFGKPVDPAEEDTLIRALHKRKTEMLVEMLASGELPLRPGIKRLMLEANRKGVLVAICTTSNEKTAEVITSTMLADVDIAFILAGDIVSRKKPDPEIYTMALAKCGFDAAECFVVEDSRNGVDAAAAAGIPVLATTNVYTENEDLSAADIILDSLGEPAGEKCSVKAGGEGLAIDGHIDLGHLTAYLKRKDEDR